MLENFAVSKHAQHQIVLRNLQIQWLDETVTNPEIREVAADRQGNTHYLKKIPEHSDRWLRVIVNPNSTPPRIVTAFFDRRVKL